MVVSAIASYHLGEQYMVDFSGFDMSGSPRDNVASVAACQTLCANRPGCRFCAPPQHMPPAPAAITGRRQQLLTVWRVHSGVWCMLVRGHLHANANTNPAPGNPGC